MITRRVFVGSLAGGLLAAPLATEAQQPARVFRLGLLGTVPLTQPGAAHIWDGLFEGLRQLGYVEGQNLIIEGRFSEGRSERLPTLAAELVRLNVDVIVAAATTADEAKRATSTIPIVMTNHGGLSALSPALVGKQLQLLKE